MAETPSPNKRPKPSSPPPHPTHLPHPPPPPPTTRPFRHIHVTVHCTILPPSTVHYSLTAQHSTRAQRRVDARQRKFDLAHSSRHSRRQLHKERARQRKRKALEETEGGGDEGSQLEGGGEQSPPAPPTLRGKRLRASVVERSLAAPRVVVDLSYEELMTEPDVHSLAKQIRFLYADNVHAAHPMRLVLSSFGPLPADADAQPEDDSTAHSRQQQGSGEGERKEGAPTVAAARLYDCLRRNTGFHSWVLTSFPYHFLRLPPSPLSSASPSSPPPTSPPASFVYLTAESPTLLTSLEPSTTYVIGGLVDHNRLKGHCHAAAAALCIPTARLPLTECMQVEGGHRTVITVNQVYQCLLHWWQAGADKGLIEEGEQAQTEGWERRWCDVFTQVLPPRQGWQVRAQFTTSSSSIQQLPC